MGLVATARQLKISVPKTLCFKRPSPGGFAAIGDSITAGHSRPEWGLHARDSWVSYLVRDGVPYCFNGARPETPTPMLMERLPLVLAHQPDRLVFVVGGFDVWKEQHERGIADISVMIDRCDEAGVIAVLGTLPPIADYNRPIREFNGRLRSLAGERGLAVIDFWAALQVDGEYRPGLTIDGLHPSVEGAKVMAAAALRTLQPR